jgi:hypothetical protein
MTMGEDGREGRPGAAFVPRGKWGRRGELTVAEICVVRFSQKGHMIFVFIFPGSPTELQGI